jgi:hypothetical protein
MKDTRFWEPLVNHPVLVNPTSPNSESTLRDAQSAARTIGLEIQVLNAGTSREPQRHRSCSLREVIRSEPAPFPRAMIERLGVITSRPVLGGLHHQYCRI